MSEIELSKKIKNYIHTRLQSSTSELISEYNSKIIEWRKKLKKLEQSYIDKGFSDKEPEIIEVKTMQDFLDRFLLKRFQEAQETKGKLQLEYLKSLPPFHFEGEIQTFLTHFFEINVTKFTNQLEYKKKNYFEKEIAILLDMYKVKKTIETINTLSNEIEKPNPFPSSLTKEQQKDCLHTFKKVFLLLFSRCIQPQYQQEVYKNLSKEFIAPSALEKRVKNNQHYVYQHVLEKYDYRNQFFIMYFRHNIKTKIKGEEVVHYFNFLDLELIKKEFLTHWLSTKLKNNPNKFRVYDQYMIGDETIGDLIRKDPSQEVALVSQLPITAFNNITAEVNESVEDTLKTNITIESSSHGEFFNFTKQIKNSIEWVKEVVEKVKNSIFQKEEEVTEQVTEEILEEDEEEYSIEITLIKADQIDYPYFLKEIIKYKAKFSLLKIKFGNDFIPIMGKVTRLLSNSSESSLIKRRTPKHEWALPYLLEENKNGVIQKHLIILGAEVKNRQLGMTYNKAADSQYEFTPFILYGTNKQNNALGVTDDTRKVMNANFYMYSVSNKEALECHKIYATKVFESISNGK